MTNSILYRLQQTLLEKKCSSNKLSSLVGISQSALNKQMRGIASVSLKTIECVLDLWPDVSAEWLLRGDGDMFKHQGNTQVNYGNNSVQAIGSIVTNNTDEQPVSVPLYDNGATMYDDASKELSFVSTNLRIMKPVIPQQIKRQPGIDIYQFMCENKENLNYEPNLPQATEYTATVYVVGDELLPRYVMGAEICLKYLGREAFVMSGKLYMLDHKDLGCILRYIIDNGDTYICRSNNPDKYPDFEVRKEDVYGIWMYVADFKTA